MSTGSAQEMRLVQYLKRQGYAEVIHGEEAVKAAVGLPTGPSCKCADVVAFLPARPGCREAVVAESKGTGVASAIKQLGNAAAGVLETRGRQIEVRLLLYRSVLKKLPVGLSPGPGYLVQTTADPKLYQLLDATSHQTSLARAKCELPGVLHKWNSVLQKLVIEVCVE
jgi:hypothetical protein